MWEWLLKCASNRKSDSSKFNLSVMRKAGNNKILMTLEFGVSIIRKCYYRVSNAVV